MTYNELQHHIVHTLPNRLPQSLYEMYRTWPLVNFINSRYSCHYDEVIKESKYDSSGVDTTIIDTSGVSPNLYIQLTRAREYDMQPDRPHTVDISGKPIIDALGTKCAMYQERGVITHEIILLIDGITPSIQMYELAQDESFMQPFMDVRCFAGVYFCSDLVFELRPLQTLHHAQTG